MNVLSALIAQENSISFDTGIYYYSLITVFWLFLFIESFGKKDIIQRHKNKLSLVIVGWFMATLLLAFFIPMRCKEKPEISPLKSLEHDLHSVVAFFILPVFAFANAGINLSGVGLSQLLHPVPLGIAMGLFVGKQVGIFGLCALCIKLKIAQLPQGMNWASLYGTAALCGIGFTMSLFVGSLAFEETGVNMIFDERLGIILGSLASGLVGFVVLNLFLPKNQS